MTDLTPERLRAATGPNKELDADILEAIGGCAHRETEYYCIEDGNDYDSGFTCKKCGEDTYGMKIDRYTSSIDAALALVERMLPGWTIGGLRQGDNKQWTAELREGHATSYDRVIIEPRHWNGTTLPLAILAALFTALEAKERT